MLKRYLRLNCFGWNRNVLTINVLFFNGSICTCIAIFVNNPKHPPLVIKMKVFQIFKNPFQFLNYKIWSLSCWLKGKPELPLPNYKVKVANSCVYIYMDIDKWKYKVVEYRRFPLQISLELLAYYNSDRGDNTTNQGHQLCFSLM